MHLLEGACGIAGNVSTWRARFALVEVTSASQVHRLVESPVIRFLGGHEERLCAAVVDYAADTFCPFMR